ncbi:MAG TPA: HAD-IIIC family phosphatase [Verrucomicrobiae bacterium]|nr:HAD-IIIC family phosphatase [Verrucomicrobiae bacterium]
MTRPRDITDRQRERASTEAVRPLGHSAGHPPAEAPPAATPGLTEVEPGLFAQHNGSRYRTPVDLRSTPTPPTRFLVVGGCLAQAFPEIASKIDPQFQGDFLLLNNFDSLPEFPASPSTPYDFQIVHIPLRSIFGSAYFRLPDDGSQHEEFLHQTQDRLARYLSNALKWNAERRLLTFVLGFLVSQQNPLGRFQPRYDLRNVVHFIERLNMFFAAELARYPNAWWVDVDQLAAGIGKKFCQDDMVWSFTHGTTLSDGDHDHDLNRIQPTVSMQHHYSQRWLEFFEALLHEIFAMYRTTRQLDLVKLVAVDLDDTLWRGIAAEGSLGVLEGWPMGFIETLLYLKKRGILLAVVSRNDEQFIQSRWSQIVQGRIDLDDFAIRKINFLSKAQNVADMIREVNLRPENVVMIDDNPVERAAIHEQIPGVRLLGQHPYYLKRILLWSPETQSPVITGESGRKTEMVQAQLHRETTRRALSHEEFLRTLNLRVSLSVIHDVKDMHMNRVLELFNKTNQFNTTGVRYTLEQCHQLLVDGRQIHAIEAEDRFTSYGLIGAAWVRGNCIDHLVMSCRALGLGIEETLLAHLAQHLAAGGESVLLGRLLTTNANMACRQLYSRNGFSQVDGDPTLWSRPLATPLSVPPHVQLTGAARGNSTDKSAP